jgi:hypothetical protein
MAHISRMQRHQPQKDLCSFAIERENRLNRQETTRAAGMVSQLSMTFFSACIIWIDGMAHLVNIWCHVSMRYDAFITDDNLTRILHQSKDLSILWPGPKLGGLDYM